MAGELRIILFGGSFDPIHTGHLAVARRAVESLAADRLIFIPARRSPHKHGSPCACGADRLEMVRLAVSETTHFQVSDCELIRPEPSYTLDSVMHFRKIFGPDAQLFWLLGADAVDQLPNWRCIGAIMEQCRICIMYRGGFEKPDLGVLKGQLGAGQISRLEQDIIETPLVDVSSSLIRRRLADGISAAGMLPGPVWRYICKKGLYGCGLKNPDCG